MNEVSTVVNILMEEQKKDLVLSLEKTLQTTLEQYQNMQRAGKKGELEYLYISLLFSGVLCNTPLLRIDLYDKQNRMDLVECYAYWDIPLLRQRLSLEFPTLTDAIVNQSWFDFADCLYLSLNRWIPQILHECECVNKQHCTCLYGKYMGDATIIMEGQV